MEFSEKKVIIFDLDGTLTSSKSAMTPEFGAVLAALLAQKKVAVISGGNLKQFTQQFLLGFSSSEPFKNLFLLPTSGSCLYEWKNGGWNEEYAELLTPKERERIILALKIVLKEAGMGEKGSGENGDVIEDRDSQVTLSALGQKAPLSEKKKWDPDQAKRKAMVARLLPMIPEFDVTIGGTTSLDVTKKGINKSYGIRQLSKFLNIPISEMLFVGDALFPGGNDYPARATGVDCLEVTGPDDTRKHIEEWIASSM